jgi:hypothetical protein
MLHDPGVVLRGGDELLAIVHADTASGLEGALGPPPAAHDG